MSEAKILDPSALALKITEIVAIKDKVRRSKLLEEVRLSASELLTAAGKKHGNDISKKDFKAVETHFNELLGSIIERNSKARIKAGSEFINVYTIGHPLPSTDTDIAKKTVAALLIQKAGMEGDIMVCPDELINEDPPPIPKHISIKKPGSAEIALKTVTLSTDFEKFLRLNHTKDHPLTQLLSKDAFETWIGTAAGQQWLEEQGLPQDLQQLDIAEIYRTQLQKAFSDFERDAYNKQYCRPNNIAMPGIQYGHRLLRLPFVLEEETDFADAQLYQGPAGRLQVPEVDLEELVRRYANALYLKSTTVYNLDDITEEYIDTYFTEQSEILDPDKIIAFSEATKYAVTADALTDYIRESIEQGRDVTPEQLNAWLQNEEIEEAVALKNEIIDNWESIISHGVEPGLFAELPNATRFRQLLLGLCACGVGNGIGPDCAGAAFYSCSYSGTYPPPIPWEIGEITAITNEEKGPENFPEEGDGIEYYEAVVKRIDALSNVYDRLWRALKTQLGEDVLLGMKDDITYSGYEMKSVVSWLALGTLFSFALDGSNLNFNGYWKKNGEERRYTSRLAHDNYLRPEIESWGLLISEEDVLTSLGVDYNSSSPSSSWSKNVFYSNGDLRDELNILVGSTENKTGIVGSYVEMLDVLRSLSSAKVISSPVTEEPVGPELDILYRYWTDIFTNFLRHYSAKRKIAKESRFTVRLAPRSGKFDEIPKPEAKNEDFDSKKILPSHPLMQTERYMLEPMPAKYACNAYPTLFLREDLSVRIRHRGFGIGANLYSMSLLPEEEQVITVKSYKETKIKTSESTAENIFEEATDETSKDFANEMQQESEREASSQSEFNISGKASASFGFGSASIETGYSTQSNSRSLAKNASNVSNRLASKLSAKRTVSIESKRTTDTELEEHSEIATERKVKNPNKGHTLTFHWFQMTRKLATELRLEDMKLVYTSGHHKIITVFGNGKPPKLSDLVDEVPFRALPDDIGRKLPPDTIIVICGEPYTESIPFSNANSFFARVFTEQKAQEVSAGLWQLLGCWDPAPEGYGIAAFCGPRRTEPNNCQYISVTDLSLGPDPGVDRVPADEINIRGNAGSIFLPNIDLRYKREDGLAPTRYWADEFDAYSLPRTLLREEYVINTNGVYCDAMVGQCTALEDYLQRHRDLDLIEKKIEVGNKELEFKWALEKDNLEVVLAENDETISGIIKEKSEGEGFKSRKELEELKNIEEKAIANAKIRKQQLQKELQLLDKKIKQAGINPDYKLDIPENTQLNINADIALKNKK